MFDYCLVSYYAQIWIEQELNSNNINQKKSTMGLRFFIVQNRVSTTSDHVALHNFAVITILKKKTNIDINAFFSRSPFLTFCCMALSLTFVYLRLFYAIESKWSQFFAISIAFTMSIKWTWSFANPFNASHSLLICITNKKLENCS